MDHWHFLTFRNWDYEENPAHETKKGGNEDSILLRSHLGKLFQERGSNQQCQVLYYVRRLLITWQCGCHWRP